METCNHPEETRFYARDENGYETMMCGTCGTVYSLVHACAVHAVIAVETADVIMYHVFGPDGPCIPRDDVPTLESLLTA